MRLAYLRDFSVSFRVIAFVLGKPSNEARIHPYQSANYLMFLSATSHRRMIVGSQRQGHVPSGSFLTAVWTC